MAHTFVDQLRFSRSWLVHSLAGIGEEQARRRPEPVNSLSWTVGLIVDLEHDWQETRVTLPFARHSLNPNPCEQIFRALPGTLANTIFTNHVLGGVAHRNAAAALNRSAPAQRLTPYPWWTRALKSVLQSPLMSIDTCFQAKE
jgi:hypothetical protein